MKFLIKLLLFMCIIKFAAANTVYACETGFACSINDLEQNKTEQEKIYIEKINNFFNKKINEDLFFGFKDEFVDYNDLFVFKSVL